MNALYMWILSNLQLGDMEHVPERVFSGVARSMSRQTLLSEWSLYFFSLEFPWAKYCQLASYLFICFHLFQFYLPEGVLLLSLPQDGSSSADCLQYLSPCLLLLPFRRPKVLLLWCKQDYYFKTTDSEMWHLNFYSFFPLVLPSMSYNWKLDLFKKYV